MESKISTLSAKEITESNVSEIGETWLTICSALFADDSGYEYDENNRLRFIPSSLKCEASTEDLSSMLEIADAINGYADTYGLPDVNSYLTSILAHLRQRADNGDTIAATTLRKRIERKVMDGEAV